MALFIFIVLLIIAIIIIGSVENNEKQEIATKRENEMSSIISDHLNKLPFNFDECYKIDRYSRLILDKKKKCIVFYNYNHNPTHKDYSFSSILESNVIQDGETTTQSSNTVGRAIVGGVLAGSAGAIVGGLSGKKKNKQIVKELTLEIVLNDLNNPVENIVFFKNDRGVEITDSDFQAAKKEIEYWYRLLTVIISQNKNTSMQGS